MSSEPPSYISSVELPPSYQDLFLLKPLTKTTTTSVTLLPTAEMGVEDSDYKLTRCQVIQVGFVLFLVILLIFLVTYFVR